MNVCETAEDVTAKAEAFQTENYFDLKMTSELHENVLMWHTWTYENTAVTQNDHKINN